ncbi:MAG: helix-turn-helix domain-containing protein [Planctomycetes bacterium]|nr:helix-turn-helix domain-containing protein [Planctomycetota bacterium]
MDDDLFKEFVNSCEEHIEIAQGKKEAYKRTVIAKSDVKGIRGKLKITQERFAQLLGVSVWTLRNWEQGRRAPEGAAVTVLKIAEREPEALLRAMQA